MSDLILTATTTAQTNLYALRQTVGRAANRLRLQDGQDIVEYGGMLVLIAGVVALLFSLQVPQTVATAFAHALNAIFGTNHTYTPPSPITVQTGG